ncbi:MAG: type VI secretion protein [Hydrogenoanaerobacterium sp.]
MNNEELLKKMRAARFIENNGRVLRTINILRHKYEQLKDIRFALDDLEEAGFLDCINFLTEAGYIKLRSVASKACSAIEDADYTLLEAKLTEKGIRLLSGQLADDMVEI